MRDIKFRVWNGEAMITENVVFLGKSGFAIDLDGMDWDFEFGRFGKPELVGMQYTGLKDKNGVEIYEGDVVSLNKVGQIESSDIYFEVKWSDESYSWVIYHSDVEFYMLYDFDFWVIGNIHQNPELLGN